MRTLFLKTLVILVVVLTAAGVAFAADFADRIAEQQRKIDNGIASGKLNRNEANVLQDNLNWIKAEYARLRADGRLSPAEQKSLDSMLDQNGSMISKKKNNQIRKVYDFQFQDRIHEQQRRIDQGIGSGELTRKEADILQDNLNWIKARLAQLDADGRLTPMERENLDRMLDRNNRMIHNKKNNPVARVY